MFGLADEIGGDAVGVGGLVSRDHRLGRAGDHVDTDLAEQLALGFGHVGVAGPDDDVGRSIGEEPEGQRGDGLHATQAEHDVGAGDVGRGQNRRVHTVSVIPGR